MFDRFSATTPLTFSLISWSLVARPGASVLSVSEKARRFAIITRRSSLLAAEISLRSEDRVSMLAMIRFSRFSFPATTVRRTSVVSRTFRMMSVSACLPSSVPIVSERVRVKFCRSSEISDTLRMISSRLAGGIVSATRPPGGSIRSVSFPGRISTYFSPSSPCVWIEATESTGIRIPSWIRRIRRAWFPSSSIASTFPIGTPAIFTFAFGSSPAAVSKSTVSLYPFAPMPPIRLTRNVKKVRTTIPSSTKIPTLASLDISAPPASRCRPIGGRSGGNPRAPR